MKTLRFKNYIGFALLAATLLTGCRKDDVPPLDDDTNGTGTATVIPKATDVNKFIYSGLQDYYLWQSQIPKLVDTKYKNSDSLNVYLNKYSDPEVLFKSLLYKYKEVDKWSFLVDNAKEIEDWIKGISETMGYDFMLGRIGSSDNLFGFVRYVLKGSPADKAGLKRGDIFLSVNDQQLTVSNYQALLFSTLTYKLGFATITNNTISPISKTMTMTAVIMQENPILKDTVFTFNNLKIGYLVYNGFNADFDTHLNDVFKRFKTANIDRLILDLRYNGGGSVTSSIYLASMIYSTDKNKVFARAQYNTAFQKALVDYYGTDYVTDYFVNTIEKTELSDATPITSLNLQQIHIIVSDNTASASELLINGLRPYMKVTVVGENTSGKYTGSTTIKDWDDKGNVNPNHKYAMQPIVVKYANSNGESDYVNGLTPNVIATEDIANLLPFGDPNEKLLSYALADIKGIPITAQTLKSAKIGLVKVAQSSDFKPYNKEMYINPEKFRLLQNLPE